MKTPKRIPTAKPDPKTPYDSALVKLGLSKRNQTVCVLTSVESAAILEQLTRDPSL